MKGYAVPERKLHWWLAGVVTSQGMVGYDHFSIEFSTIEKQVNSQVLFTVRESLSKKKDIDLGRVIINSISYLGEMTKDGYYAS